MSRKRRRNNLKLVRSVSPASQATEPRSLPYPGHWFSALNARLRPQMDDTEEYPTRSVDIAAQLIGMVNYCPEAATALEVTCAYALSSGTGDELGFAVVSEDATVQAIARAVLDRCLGLFDYWQIIWRLLAWGDAFGFMEVNPQLMQVDRVRLLPSWQVHAIPDRQGSITHYEQRFYTSFSETAMMQPATMLHWAYNKRHLYGRSLFYESIPDWVKLQDADDDVAEGSRSSAIQPNIHLMPPGADENYKRAYKEDHENRRKRGVIPDVYLLQGADIKKPQGPPSGFPVGQLLEHFSARRLRIAMRSRVPLYLLGIDVKYAREIAYQPALAFVVHVGVVRQLFSAGLRRLIDTELALKQIPQPWSYQIRFPTINVNPWMPAIDEDVNQPGVEESDALVLRNGHNGRER